MSVHAVAPMIVTTTIAPPHRVMITAIIVLSMKPTGNVSYFIDIFCTFFCLANVCRSKCCLTYTFVYMYVCFAFNHFLLIF